jgi:Transposase DDE domain
VSSSNLKSLDNQAKEDTMNLLELFCHVDDFTKTFVLPKPEKALPSSKKTRERPLSMNASEIMTILIHFHQERHRDFKTYYQNHVCQYLNAEFPKLPSYQRFVEWIPRALIPLTAYLFAHLGSCSGITFVDSTPLVVCHNRRIHSHKTFKDIAARGHTSVGWFFGFKLHLLFNDQGEIVWLQLTPGNTDDRKGLLEMLENPLSTVFGKLIGDKGYVSQALLTRLANEFRIQMVTRLKKKMHTKLPMLALDAWLLRKRAIAESIIDQLKNISQIEHSRHRSPLNFLVNLMCGLIAYCHQPKKPGLLRVTDELIAA